MFGWLQSIPLGRALVGLSAIMLVVFGLERAGVFSDGKIYRSQLGEVREVVLADGSNISLNNQSELSVTIARTIRSARLLRGEAYVDIVADENRPFSIYAGSGRIVASVAARVHLRLWKGQMMIGVAGGEVFFNQWHQTAVPIRSGESRTFTMDGRTSKAQAYNPIDELAWRQRKLVLHDVDLSIALESLLRYYGVSAVIEDPELKQARVTGEFPTNDLQLAMQTLEQWGAFSITLGDDRVMHVRSRH